MCSWGEVWLCTGQSNMVWPVRRSAGSEEITKDANQPLIRLAYVAGDSRCPLAATDRDSPWFVTSPDVVGDYSAVAYSFGLDLRRELDVPIGLVLAAASGTPVETWLPPGPPSFGRPIGGHFKHVIQPLIPYAIRGADLVSGRKQCDQCGTLPRSPDDAHQGLARPLGAEREAGRRQGRGRLSVLYRPDLQLRAADEGAHGEQACGGPRRPAEHLPHTVEHGACRGH